MFVTEGKIQIVRIQISKHRNYQSHFKDCEQYKKMGYKNWQIINLFVDPKEAAQFKFHFCCENTFQHKALKALTNKED